MANKIHVKTGDTVIVISGKQTKQTGKVLAVIPKKNKVLVEAINIIHKHQKPNKQNAQGGIIDKEAPIFSSRVMLYCTKCKSATRIQNKILEDGTKVRVCKKCGETL